MSYTPEEIRTRAIEIMATNCMVCKNYGCNHSMYETYRTECVTNSSSYFMEDHFDCFEETPGKRFRY